MIQHSIGSGEIKICTGKKILIPWPWKYHPSPIDALDLAKSLIKEHMKYDDPFDNP